MTLPYLRARQGKLQRETVAFGGLNYTDRVQDGDAADSRNISLRRWPCLATRRGRRELEGYSACTALSSWNKLIAVDGTRLLYDGRVVGQVSAGEKQFAVLNTKVVIWPDRVYFDLQDNKLVPLGATLTAQAGTATFTSDSLTIADRVQAASGKRLGGFRDSSGGTLEGLYVRRLTSVRWSEADGWSGSSWSEVPLKALAKGDMVMLTADDTILFRWNSAWETPSPNGRYGVVSQIDAVWSAPGYGETNVTVYADIFRCVLNGKFTDCFRAGDTVSISGAGVNNKDGATIKTVEDKRLTFAAGTFTPATNITLQVSVSRGIPGMDFICQSDNRLWGCSSDSQSIYASALGDPTNFHTVQGLSTDSYTVPVGSEGAFTGCCRLGSSVLFWKEHTLHKVLGSTPAQYAVYSYDLEGLKAGCHRSMQIVDEVLYYLGTQGVYAYSGSTPRLISACFGQRSFASAAAGSDGGRYYLSALDDTGTWRLLVYDIELGLWVHEDNLRCRDFARVGRELYFADGQGRVYLADSGQEQEGLEWMVQFAPFYESVEGHKRYSRLLLRLELPQGSWLEAQMRCDGGLWRPCGRAVGRKSGVTQLRLAVNRCDRFELRLHGKGSCAVLSMLREFKVGNSL